jgi:hypothetical protein
MLVRSFEAELLIFPEVCQNIKIDVVTFLNIFNTKITLSRIHFVSGILDFILLRSCMELNSYGILSTMSSFYTDFK